MADVEDEKGSKTYSLYSSLRRYFEPLREHWDKLTPQEQAVVIKEVEAFLNFSATIPYAVGCCPSHSKEGASRQPILIRPEQGFLKRETTS